MNKKLEKTAIDATDIKIIQLYLKNSRISLSEVAKKCDTTTLTIRNRYNKLKKKGVIKGSTVLADLANIGIEADASFLLHVKNQQLNKFINDMQNMTGILCIPTKLVEKCEAIIWKPVRDIKEVERAKEMLKHHSAVTDIRTSLWTYMRVIPENITPEPSKRR